VVHAGEYGTEDIKTTNQTQPRKANNTKHSKIKLPLFYDTRPGKEMGLFYLRSTICTSKFLSLEFY